MICSAEPAPLVSPEPTTSSEVASVQPGAPSRPRSNGSGSAPARVFDSPCVNSTSVVAGASLIFRSKLWPSRGVPAVENSGVCARLPVQPVPNGTARAGNVSLCTETRPTPPRPLWKKAGAPTAKSGHRSPSRSPTAAIASPKRELAEPASVNSGAKPAPEKTITAPAVLLVCGAPIAISGRPSPSRSPAPAKAKPNSSPSEPLKVCSRLPLVPDRTSTRAFEREARKSGVPSALTSPSDATRWPRKSPKLPVVSHCAAPIGGKLGSINHKRPASVPTKGSLTTRRAGALPIGRSLAIEVPKRAPGSPTNERIVVPLRPFRIET